MLSLLETISKKLALCLIIFSLLLWPDISFSRDKKNRFIVLTRPQAMQTKPRLETSRIRSLPSGTRVQVIGRANGWLKINHQGRIGYIRNLRANYRSFATASDSKSKKIPKTGLEKKADAIQKDIRKRRKKVSVLTQKEQNILQQFNRSDHTLNTLQKKAGTVKVELNKLGKNLHEMETRKTVLLTQIQAAEKYAAQRLVALYKLNRMGQINLLASAESIHSLFYLQKGLEQILEHDADFRTRLMQKKKGLSQVLLQLKQQRTRKKALDDDYRKKIKTMSREKQHRSMLLKKIRSQRRLQIAALDELKQAATRLDRTIKSYKKSVQSAKPLKMSSPALSQFKGLLQMPVQGKIISKFGPYKDPKFQLTHHRNGIEIKAEAGSPIHAVSGGRVAYAGWFKGYGNMIIIDHGKGYFSVYANIHDLFKNRGDSVRGGEVIATVGESASLIGPKLYFEVRYQGKPINPLTLLKQG